MKSTFAHLDNRKHDGVATVYDHGLNHNIITDGDGDNASNTTIRRNFAGDGNNDNISIDDTICDAIDKLPDSV